MTDTSTNTARFNDLIGARYVALTTFRRDGTPVHTPVWPVDAGDGRVGIITSSQTWKAKRIAHDPRVVLRPSDARGRVDNGAAAVTGTADVVTGDRFRRVRDGVKAKYGYQLRLIDFVHALPGRPIGHPNDCAIVIALDPG